MAKTKKSMGSSMGSSSSSSHSMGLDRYAVAYVVAILAAAKVLVWSVLARFGVAPGAAEVLDKLLMTWNSSFSGILTGMAEAAICGLIVGFVGATLYNKFS